MLCYARGKPNPRDAGRHVSRPAGRRQLGPVTNTLGAAARQDERDTQDDSLGGPGNCLEVYLQKRAAKRQGGGRRPRGASPLVFSPSIAFLRPAVLRDDRGENTARRIGGSGFCISSSSHALQRRHAPTEGRDKMVVIH